MVNVTFVEEGRQGANHQVADTSALLDRLIADELGGDTTGLRQLRIHTQPIREDKIHLFPIGREFNAFITRALYSTPQLRQQEHVRPRMIDGRPTFFLTWLADNQEDDKDNRLSNDVLASIHPEYFDNIIVSQTAETRLEGQESVDEQMLEMNQSLAERPLSNLRPD